MPDNELFGNNIVNWADVMDSWPIDYNQSRYFVAIPYVHSSSSELHNVYELYTIPSWYN